MSQNSRKDWYEGMDVWQGSYFSAGQRVCVAGGEKTYLPLRDEKNKGIRQQKIWSALSFSTLHPFASTYPQLKTMLVMVAKRIQKPDEKRERKRESN